MTSTAIGRAFRALVPGAAELARTGKRLARRELLAAVHGIGAALRTVRVESAARLLRHVRGIAVRALRTLLASTPLAAPRDPPPRRSAEIVATLTAAPHGPTLPGVMPAAA